MNETIHPDVVAAVPWPSNSHQVRVPNTSMLPGSDVVAQRVAGLPNQAAQGAHDTIDRLAESVASAVPPLGGRVSAASDVIHAKADPLRDTGEECVESVRATVRSNPLASIAAAAALGAVIASITGIAR